MHHVTARMTGWGQSQPINFSARPRQCPLINNDRNGVSRRIETGLSASQGAA